MFGLRASVFRTPALFRRLYHPAGASGQQTAADFLTDIENDADDLDVRPTAFEEDFLPPQAPSPEGYPPPQQQLKPAFSREQITKDAQPVYRLHCQSSRNNTMVTFTRPDGRVVAWFSGGSTPSKFRKANRATYEAGYQCAVGIFGKIRSHMQNEGPFRLHLFFKGFGEGREAMKTALLATEGETIRKLVSHITDRTPIKIGGTRSKKQRRG